MCGIILIGVPMTNLGIRVVGKKVEFERAWSWKVGHATGTNEVGKLGPKL